MRIERFDPETAETAISSVYRAYVDGKAVDDPHGPLMSLGVFRYWLAQSWTRWPREAWLATDDRGAVLGWYLLDLAHAAREAREHGRTQLTAYAKIGSAGEAFAMMAGARSAIVETRWALDIPALSAESLQRLRAQAEREAAGYRLLHWVGPTPEQHLEQVAAVIAAISDAPSRGENQELHWDVANVRHLDDDIVRRKLRHYSVAAQHAGSGTLAGLTQAAVAPEDPAWGDQGMTVVIRAHRGHQLGILMKVALLQLMLTQEPELRKIATWTTDANTHMEAINQALGYVILDRSACFTLAIR
jgi:hypothetical protein